jgi:predicted transcriptional regulator YheO
VVILEIDGPMNRERSKEPDKLSSAVIRYNSNIVGMLCYNVTIVSDWECTAHKSVNANTQSNFNQP